MHRHRHCHVIASTSLLSRLYSMQPRLTSYQTVFDECCLRLVFVSILPCVWPLYMVELALHRDRDPSGAYPRDLAILAIRSTPSVSELLFFNNLGR